MQFPTRTVSALPPGTAVSRFLITYGKANGDPERMAAIAAANYRDSPTVEATAKGFYTKAAVPAGTTTDTNWAGPLAAYGISAEFFQLLQTVSILSRLQPAMRRIPFRMKVPVDAAAGAAGGWAGEGLSKPLTLASLDVVSLPQAIWAVIAMATQELLRFGDPVAEKVIRDILIAAVARNLDGQFLDPDVAATASHPASITNGAVEVMSSGSTAAAILSDLGEMIGSITSPGDSLRWVMPPTVFFQIAAALAAVGLSVTPNVLLGIPAILSSTSPAQITLLDAGALVYAADDAVSLSVSTQGAIEATDTTTSPPGTEIVGFYQTNTMGLRAELTISWQRVLDNSVAFMTWPTGSPA